jgi:hypothetical protein
MLPHHRYRPSQLSLVADGTNLKFLTILLERLLVVVLPERLGGVLASEAFEDLGASRVLIDEVFMDAC